ncbi:MAG: ABC transporter substrate-binding protein [Rhizobiaceae bacterium]
MRQYLQSIRPLISGALAALVVASFASNGYAEPKHGGTLRMAINPEPPTLMVGVNPQTPVQIVGSKIYEGLLDYSFDLKPEPSLAKSWTVSADGLTYDFKLQEGVKWSDGEPFSAEDVVFSFTKFLQETNVGVRNYMANVDSVTAVSPTEVAFKLKSPKPAFLYSFSAEQAPIVPEHVYKNEKDFRNSQKNDKPIGTGPFMLDEWKHGEYIKLKRNPNYWQKGKPYLDAIYFVVIPDSASRAAALENGDIDVTSFNDIEVFDIPRLRKLPNLHVSTKGYEYLSPMMWIEVNNRKKPLDDPRFRKAMMYAIDREFIKDKIWNGLGEVAVGPLAHSTLYFDKSMKPYAYDPKKSAELLDEMGFKPNADGVRATIEMMPLPYGEVWNRMAEYVKQALAKVGIAVELKGADVAGWRKKFADWDYSTTFTYGYQYADPAVRVGRTYTSDNIKKGVPFSNESGYSNPEIDKLFAEGAKEVDPAKRQEIYSKIQHILYDDLPVLWIMEMKFVTVTNVRVHDLVTGGTGVVSSFANAYVN